MIDCHTHSLYSHDGHEQISAMLDRALSLNMEYLAITDHCDKDCLFVPEYCDEKDCLVDTTNCNKDLKKIIRQIDLASYFNESYKLKDLYRGKIEYAVGIECGYMKNASYIYEEILSKYNTDIIINSVHLVDFVDCYFKEYFDRKTKEETYSHYLNTIKNSLDVPYPYDVVAHIGYAVRKAPYQDKALNYIDFKDTIDDILKTIIEKGKALEVNSHAENTGDITLPNRQILKRYKELGGELLTFGSDAHKVCRIGDLYEPITSLLKDLGFNYLFKYINHTPIAHKI